MHTPTCFRMRARAHTHTRVHAYTIHARTYTHTHMHAQMHIHTHTHMYSHTRTQVKGRLGRSMGQGRVGRVPAFDAMLDGLKLHYLPAVACGERDMGLEGGTEG